MRILILHSRYQSGPASGENRVVEDEIQLLQERGHDVASWTPSPPASLDVVSSARLGLTSVWARGAVAKVRALIRRHRPQVIHAHNLFPLLSPSTIAAAKSEHIPTILTLHNYRLLCLPADFYRGGKVCEDCLGKIPWRGVVHSCYRGSLPASSALAVSLSFHRVRRTFDAVALFLAVSRFLRAKHVSGGIAPRRIIVRPNFAFPAQRRGGPGNYFVYMGRLSAEKGVAALIESWRDIEAPLIVAGDGPLRTVLEAAKPPNVQFVGLLPGEETAALLREARALLLPSEWYEGAPRSIPEAYAVGVPVIASRIGAIPEFVEDGVSGRLIAPASRSELVRATTELMDDRYSEMLGEGAYRLWQTHYAPEMAADTLEEAYARVLR
jgi:glycosyltransferase involved in cell wall biosynthesis